MDSIRPEEARELAIKVLELSDKMEKAYTHSPQKEIRILAVMAGIVDAYNRGKFDKK